jgi:hypothetical protein
MRVYLPFNQADLVELAASGVVPGPRPACAVTPALKQWFPEGDDEDLEYAATSRAADLSLGLVADDADPRRIVLALDAAAVIDAEVDELVGVTLHGEVRLSDVAAILVDAPAAKSAVKAAVVALGSSADAVPAEVMALDEHDLAWYAPSEVGALLPQA